MVSLLTAALAVVTASGGAVLQAQAYFESGLGPSVRYDPDQGRLDIRFPNGYDPASIDTARMHLGCDGCADIPLSGHALQGGTFGRLHYMEFSSDIQARLTAASNPVVKFQAGSYRSIWDGSVHGYKEAPVIRPQDAVDNMLKRAEYVIHANEIVLHFGAAVNLSSVDWSRVYLPGCCDGPRDGEPAAGLELARAGGDGRWAVYTLTQQARDGLLYTRSDLYMDAGAYRSANGTMNKQEQVRVQRPGIPDWWDADRWSRGGPRTLLLAEYFPGDNRLYLHFAGKVVPFSITPPRMHVGPSWNPIITLSASEFAGMADGDRSIAFELSPSNQYDMSQPDHDALQIQIEAGAVHMAADGADAGRRGAPLTIHGDFFPPDPAIPPGSPVSRVDYDRDAREIVVRFREAVDPASVNASRITLSGHRGCAISLEDGDLAGISGDGKSAAFTVDRDRNGFLRSMLPLQMNFDRGAFASAADGTGNVAVSVPLPADPHPFSGHQRWSFPKITLVNDAPCRITYSVESPSYILRSEGYGPAAVARHTETIMSAVRAGLDSWSAINPQFFFETAADGTADISIVWLDYDGTTLGRSSHCLLSCEIVIVLVGPDYLGGDLGLFSYGHIKRAVAHEFGHNLWLGHHISPNHLMLGGRSNDPLLMDPFDDLGYNVPDLGRWPGY